MILKHLKKDKRQKARKLVLELIDKRKEQKARFQKIFIDRLDFLIKKGKETLASQFDLQQYLLLNSGYSKWIMQLFAEKIS